MDRIFLNVECAFSSEGTVRPMRFQWVNRKWYDVDKVLDEVRTPSRLVGGGAVRYTVRVHDRVLRLCRDGDRWYAEA